MITHPAFSPERWEQAPQYRGPGNHELYEHLDATILDFDELQGLATNLEEFDAFELDALGVAKAPLKLGHLPAAFYRVKTGDFDSAAIHTPVDPEILVVLEGVLSIVNDRKLWLGKNDYDFAYIPGQVSKIGPYPTRMKALGFEDPQSLALVVFSQQPDNERLIISGNGATSTGKGVKWEGVQLPYTPASDPNEGLL